MNDKSKATDIFRKHWFWILMLIIALVGITLGILFPIRSGAPW